MSTGIAFDPGCTAPIDHVLLASYTRDQKLSKLFKSLEFVFYNDLADEKYNVGLYSFSDHYEGYTSHYFITEKGHFAYLITTSEYNHRCASKLLNEFIELFQSNFKKKIAKCKDGELSKPARPLFVELIEKYEDVEGIDALLRSHQKLEDAKSVMSDNVSLLLDNQDSAERVYNQSQELNKDAAMFKKNTKKLKYNLECRSRKVCFHRYGHIT
jgi:hypothetical protein